MTPKETTDTATRIWADMVSQTGIWMSPHADRVAELGRIVIPKIREALTSERERCAKIVQAAADTWWVDVSPDAGDLRHMVEAIKNGG